MRRVLIVDDSEAVRVALRLVFDGTDQFHVCGEAVDGIDAIEKAAQLNPDLILLDLAMPRMDGVEAASTMRRTNPHAKIIAFTMYADAMRDKLAAAIGVDLVLSKPDGVSSLVQHINELSERPCAQDTPAR